MSEINKSRQSLTIRLHENVEKYEDIIKPELLASDEWSRDYTKFDINPKYGEGKIYLSCAKKNPPEWKEMLKALSDNKAVAENNAYSKALIIFKLKNTHQHQFTSISIGYGESMINRRTVVSDFGKVVSSKRIKDGKMKAVDTTEITDVILQSSRQIVGTQINSSRSILGSRSEFPRSVRGTIKNGNTEIELIGNNDTLRVSRKMSLDEISTDLDFYVESYENKNIPEAQWSKRFTEVRNKEIKNDLIFEFAKQMLKNGDFAIAWPYLTDESNYKILGIKRNNEVLTEDLSVAYKIAIQSKPYTPNQLISKFYRDSLVNDNGTENSPSVKIIKALIGDIEYKNKKFLLFNGNWYEVSKDFYSEINKEFASVPHSILPFLKLESGECETKYNEKLNIWFNSQMIECSEIHPKLYRSPYFAPSGVEPADLVTKNLDFIYIKKGKSSANLSHLFLQGQVAATLISSDQNIRQFIADLSFGEEWLNKNTPKKDMKVIFAIIKNKHQLPFFSMISFVEVVRQIRSMDFNVEIAWIDEDKQSI